MLTHSRTPSLQEPGPLADYVHRSPTRTNAPRRRSGGDLRSVTDEQLATGLGWFSIGLGLIEVIAPRALGRLIGAGEYASLLPLLGMREIASGIGILRQERPIASLWSRVAGDGMDLAFLVMASQGRHSEPTRLAAAAFAVAGVTALDLLCSERVSELPLAKPAHGEGRTAIHLRHAITINKPISDLYNAWRDLDSLPQWMGHLESVKKTGEKTSHWVAKGPAGATVEWDAETVTEQLNHRIAWRSLEGSQVDTTGSIEFANAPGQRGTEIRIELTYDPPGGRWGAVIASMFGHAPEQEIQEDLRRFKSIMETGEAPGTHGQPHGRCAR